MTEQKKLFHRELSWLEFNARVLAMAQNPDTPLLERLKFLNIFSTNLDEFFMVRLAGLRKLIEESIAADEYESLDEQEHILQSSTDKIQMLIQEQYSTFNNEVLPELAKQQIRIVQTKELPEQDRKYLQAYFKSNIFPVLTPMAIDPAHPPPFFSNLDLYLVTQFRPKKREKNSSDYLLGFVQIPKILPRLLAVSEDPLDYRFVLIEDLISENLGQLYLGFQVINSSVMRITRNLDYELLENEAVDLLKSIQKEMVRREQQEVVRVEYSSTMDVQILKKIKDLLNLHDEKLFYKIPGVVDLSGFMELYRIPISYLKDKPFNPRLPAVFSSNEDIFALIDKQDILLHHPFESFYPVIEMLNTAAQHPDVVAIKQTLYRTAGDSPIIDALVEASERGKQVTAVIELKARFDEKNNIEWARRLQRAGVNVVYGLIGLKTHAKATLIIKKSGKKLASYVHLSTGNYNSNTAKLYTDISYITCERKICEDVSNLFNLLTGFNVFAGEITEVADEAIPRFSKMAISPINLRNKILKLIRTEIEHHKNHQNGRIIAKMNALLDVPIIDALYEASQAGVKIDLVVRGMCRLIPGVKGLSENIRVVSIVDRFLEHSRIFYFHQNGSDEVYLSSADWMTRNMVRRIECMFPIENVVLRARLLDILHLYLRDNTNSWSLQPDGSYQRLRTHSKEQKNIQAQLELIEFVRQDGLKSLPYDEAIRYRDAKGKKRPVASRSQKRR